MALSALRSSFRRALVSTFENKSVVKNVERRPVFVSIERKNEINSNLIFISERSNDFVYSN